MENRFTIAGLSTALAVALAGAPALGQSATEEAVIPEQAEQQTLTDDLIGQTVYSRTGEAGDLRSPLPQ